MTSCQFAKRCILVGIFAVGSSGVAWCDEVPRSVNRLIKDSCVHCHGKDGDTPLDLTAIDFDLDNEATFKKWEKVFDRLTAGEMPPDTEPEPDQRRLTAAVNRLHSDLHRTSRQRQRREGRVRARRLTKLEYANTIPPFVPSACNTGHDAFVLPDASANALIPPGVSSPVPLRVSFSSSLIRDKLIFK